MKRKILLDWDPGARSIPSLELLAKQMRSRFLGESVSVHVNGTSGGRKLEGFVLPGLENVGHSGSGGFWRTLLSSMPASGASIGCELPRAPRSGGVDWVGD